MPPFGTILTSFGQPSDVLQLATQVAGAGHPPQLPLLPWNPAIADLTRAFASKMMLKEGETARAEDEDRIRKFHALVSSLDAREIRVFQNFFMPFLNSPTGYTLIVPHLHPFTMDPFVLDLFKVVAVAELNVPDTGLEQNMAKYREILKIVIPVNSPAPPNVHTDTVSTGWMPGLGERGCSIGIYAMQPRVGGGLKRYFLVCHSCLPEKSLRQLHDAIERTHVENLQAMDYYMQIEKLRQPAVTPRVETFEDCMNRDSVFYNARELAVENAVRLIVLAAKSLGLSLRLPVQKTPPKTIVRKEERGLVAERPARHHESEMHVQYSEFRVESNDYAHYVPEKPDDVNATKLAEALKAWPEGAPIYPETRMPESHSPFPRIEYPLGPVLWKVRAKKAKVIKTAGGSDIVQHNEFDDMVKAYNHVFITEPEFVSLCVVNDYNTFRVVDGRSVQLFMGCTPLSKCNAFDHRSVVFGGVLYSQSLAEGFRLFNPNLLQAKQDPNSAITDLTPTPAPWNNQYGNAFPLVGTTVQDPPVQPPASVQECFVSRDGMQMLTTDGRWEISRDNLYALRANLETEEQLVPRAVYLSGWGARAEPFSD